MGTKEAKLRAKFVNLTPSMADDWFKLNKNFRRFSEPHARTLLDDMLCNRWEQNGDAIRRNCNGNILDGQHRLWAIARCGRPIRCLVVSGVKSCLSIDAGKKRKLKDHLDNEGLKNSQVTATAAAWLYRIAERGQAAIMNRQNPSIVALRGYLKKNPDLSKSVSFVVGKHDLLFPIAAAAAMHCLCARYDGALADKFICALEAEEPSKLPSQDAMWSLRSQLIRAEKLKKSWLETGYKIALAIKVWNSWRTKEPVSVLKWVQNGKKAEPFPVIS